MTDDPFDLVIVGAGIVGAMLAWRVLRRHPEWRTLWLDRSLLGSGASAYSGGLITPFGRTERQRSLATSSSALLVELSDDISPIPIRELTAWLAVAGSSVAERLSWFISNPPAEASLADVEELQMLVPGLRLAGNEALLGPFLVCQGHPVDLIRAIARLCRSRDRFSIWEGAEMANWTSDGDQIRVSLTQFGSVVTRRLGLATGPWLSSHTIVEARIKKVAAYHIEAAPVDSAPVILLGDQDAFLLPLPSERRWLFSFRSQTWDVDPRIPSSLAMADEDDKIAESLLQHYVPQLAAHRRGGRVFCDAYSSDRTPLVQSVVGFPNVVFAGACSGSGFRLAPAMAEQAVNLLEVA